MKRFKVVFILALVSMISLGTANAASETPLFNYKLTWNIEKVYYYLTSSATGYSSVISKSAKNWVYTGYGYNKLYPNKRATNKKNGTVDFYSVNDGNNGVIAYTMLFKKVNSNFYQVNPNSENWLYAEIRINNPVFKTLSSFDQQGTIVHEFGHAWGLAHNQTNPNSVMCQLGTGRKVNTVQQVDNDAFNRKYK